MSENSKGSLPAALIPGIRAWTGAQIRLRQQQGCKPCLHAQELDVFLLPDLFPGWLCAEIVVLNDREEYGAIKKLIERWVDDYYGFRAFHALSKRRSARSNLKRRGQHVG